MSIEDVRLKRSLRLTEQMGDKQSVQLSASEEFLILTVAKNPSFGAILEDKTSWPKIGGPLPQLDDKFFVNDKEVVCVSRDLSYYEDNEKAVVMTVRYEGKDDPLDEEKPNNNTPDAWKRITIQTQQVTQPALGWPTEGDTVDPGIGEQKSAQNSAGDPVDGLEEDVALVRMTYTNTQVAFPNFPKLHSYVNRCNSDDFLAGPSYSVRCMGWSGEYDQKNQTWSISVEFLYKPDKWLIKFYDVGFTEIVNGKRQAILDRAGNPVSKPVPLDGQGQAAAINGSPSSGELPVPLLTRELYPYLSKPFANIFNDCGI